MPLGVNLHTLLDYFLDLSCGSFPVVVTHIYVWALRAPPVSLSAFVFPVLFLCLLVVLPSIVSWSLCLLSRCILVCVVSLATGLKLAAEPGWWPVLSTAVFIGFNTVLIQL